MGLKDQLKHDDVLMAMIDLIARTGANDYRIQYDDAMVPVVWAAVCRHETTWSIGGGFDPQEATYRLLEQLVDGGMCTNCKRPTGVTLEVGSMPMEDTVCWYQYDPELKTMRRGCE